jgi:murein L,D-transpeptidase YafK
MIGVALAIAIAVTTLNFPRSRPALKRRVAKILVLKTDHKLLLLDAANNVIHTYAIAEGRGGGQAKERQGDHRTPEGFYIVDRRKGDSRFHRALHVSYPNDNDRERARKLGVDPGGDIMIHGIENGLGWIGPLHRAVDWTDGCMAVTDPEIEEIWATVPDGTPIEIRR